MESRPTESVKLNIQLGCQCYLCPELQKRTRLDSARGFCVREAARLCLFCEWLLFLDPASGSPSLRTEDGSRLRSPAPTMQATGDNHQPSAAAFVRKGCLGICPTGSSNTRLAGFCLHSKTRPARPGLLSSRPFSLAPTDDPGGLATLPRTYTLHINPLLQFLIKPHQHKTASGVRSAEKKGAVPATTPKTAIQLAKCAR